MAAGTAPVTLYGYFVRDRKILFPLHQVTRIRRKRGQACFCMADRTDAIRMGQAPCLLPNHCLSEKDIWFNLQKMVNGRIIGMAGPPGDLADGWEENQTLVGGVLFFLCPLLQIPSYCFSCPMQEKSVPFFTARCMSYCFYREILICGDCIVATPFKMPSNKFPSHPFITCTTQFHNRFSCGMISDRV